MIISKTPVRLSFFGGGTDYRQYFETNGGAVLGTTIDKHIYVSVNKLTDFFDYRIRVGYSKAELVKSVEDIVHPSVRETLRFKSIVGNLDIHIFADLPARTGTGSSSAFTVGLLNALYALEGRIISRQQLAEEAMYIEQELIHENVGCQDQMHAAHGGFNIIEFSAQEIGIRPVIIADEKRRLLTQSLMVFFTGIRRFASEILTEQIEKTKTRELDPYLRQIHRMVFEAQDIIAGSHREHLIGRLGSLLDRSWGLKKKLSGQITNAAINAAYDKAMAAGACGGKLAGAGAGGFLIFLVPPEHRAAVRQALSPLQEVSCQFADEGSQIIYLKN